MKEYEYINKAMKKVPEFDNGSWNRAGASIYYQYRSFTSFWQIIESDSFWATDARFCNDEEEQRFGEHVIDTLYRGKDSVSEKKSGLDENYIVCFCKDDDRLSQWRGYASEGGVSMGFDFGAPHAFSVMHSQSESVKTKADCELQYVALGAVCYMDPRGDQEKDEEYRQKCLQKIDIIDYFLGENTNALYQQEVQRKAPFIKHSGFSEECEYRLVFHNHDGELNKCIRYRDDEKSMLKYPYIVVKTSLPEDMQKKCVVRIGIDTEKEIELVNKLNSISEVSVVVLGCHYLPGQKYINEKYCRGCTIRRMETSNSWQQCRYNVKKNKVNSNYCLDDKESCVIVSQGSNQEKVFENVYRCVQEFKKQENTEIDVWCEGHLPLRSITVGPCQNQSNMVEAIRHYCEHKYWLRDVKIKVSKIPFRKSL